MIDETLSHYRILRRLGGGGMGEVYLAEDTRLGRKVALKFLRAEAAQDRERRRRFVQEAKAASALDHPHICTVYEIDETPEGQLFLAMAYYEGETLKETIEHGPLELKVALDFAIQVAEGLKEAHNAGIVHRDVKPANVIVTQSGLVKIVDFGLAKLSGGENLTRTGFTMGTVAYMSPEQTMGEPVDLRSDIWSSGVVLYEMVSGRLPFQGEHPQAVSYAVLHKQPPPLPGQKSAVPEGVEHVVNRALAKNPTERYQSAAQLVAALRKLQRDAESRMDAPSADSRFPTAERNRESVSSSVSCAECHHENPTGHKFCRKCGSSLASNCPPCGREVLLDSLFCGHCGHTLTSPPATPSVDDVSEKKPSGSATVLERERRQVTIAQCNLAGYSDLLDRLEPEQVEQIVGDIEAAVNEIVENHGGIVNQFTGDGLVALFGIPTAHEDDFLRAARAALQLHARVREIASQLESGLGQEMRLQTGIHTGQVVSQSDDSGDGRYKVTGEPLQLAIQLATQADVDEILVSPATRGLIAPYFELEAGAQLRAKGRRQTITIYKVLRESDVRTRLEAGERTLTKEEYYASGTKSKEVLGARKDIVWVRSYISEAEGKCYCEYDAPNKDAMREYSRLVGVPEGKISQVSLEVNPTMFK